MWKEIVSSAWLPHLQAKLTEQHEKSGQAPGRTPAREEAGGGQLLNRQHAPVEGQAQAGTMAQKVVGRLSHPSTNWLARTYTFLAKSLLATPFLLSLPKNLSPTRIGSDTSRYRTWFLPAGWNRLIWRHAGRPVV